MELKKITKAKSNSTKKVVHKPLKKDKDIPSEGRTFIIDAEEDARFNKWVKKSKIKHEDAGAAGGAYTWCFTPTGLGTLVVVEDIKGNKIILRGTENW
jgi:hypothetical protein